jgi:hypothetical protein
MSTSNERAGLRARTHADTALLLRRPFAPGAIGFWAMMKLPLHRNRSGPQAATADS